MAPVLIRSVETRKLADETCVPYVPRVEAVGRRFQESPETLFAMRPAQTIFFSV